MLKINTLKISSPELLVQVLEIRYVGQKWPSGVWGVGGGGGSGGGGSWSHVENKYT